MPLMCANCRNFRVLQVIGVEDRYGDIKFQTGGRNVVCMRNGNVCSIMAEIPASCCILTDC